MIGSGVSIGEGTVLSNSVTIIGKTTIGVDNEFGPGSVIGGKPQDFKYRGGQTRLVIGDRNVVRDCVTVNTGTEHGGGITTIGDDNFLMACCHIAHDCVIHNNVVIPNGVLLAGHVEVEDHVLFGGNIGIHHYTTVGKYAFIGGLTRVVHDVPPFMLLEGHPSKVRTINRIGIERHGFSAEAVQALKEAHRVIWRKDYTRKEAFDHLHNGKYFTDEVEYLVDFLARADNGFQGRARQPKPKRT
jgi:UDP-N-acetylglucosamine acyltransferase